MDISERNSENVFPICNRALDVIPLDFERHLNLTNSITLRMAYWLWFRYTSKNDANFLKPKYVECHLFSLFFGLVKNLDAKCHISNTRLPKMAYAKNDRWFLCSWMQLKRRKLTHINDTLSDIQCVRVFRLL